ncbi:MAG: extracellular solute-binding protein [Lachnospiraceae bacterium]|nr:extracellular solute-binding protein [Lachnospiraceae bacterium]
MKKKFNFRRLYAGFATLVLLTLTACAGSGTGTSGGREPVNITVWTYYNGAQLSAFNTMIDEFNETVGKEEGITVTGANLGSVNDLETAVMDAAQGKVGADEMPNIFSAYADNAYALDRMGLLADLNPYLTDEEKSRYIDSFLEEGRISSDESLKIFPVAKSTELLLINETDFAPFAAACGVSYQDLTTVEGLTLAGEKYYHWTDEQTPEENDGKALFGRDAMANYFLVGAAQMGMNLIEVRDNVTTINFDKEVVRRLWDNYYIPYVKGFFASSGRFRSDDVKTGNILCYVGSSASATYFPDTVVIDDSKEHAVTLKVMRVPVFEGGTDCAVQQGAGMVVTKSNERTEAACVRFLTWFTERERNTRFAMESAYLPVTKEAMSMEAIRTVEGTLSPQVENILDAAIETMRQSTLYTQKASAYGTAMRDVLEYAMSDLAAQDREKVLAAIEDGTEYGAAIAPYTSDEYFDTWYEDTFERLNRYAEEANKQVTEPDGE